MNPGEPRDAAGLDSAVVLRVEENVCHVLSQDTMITADYAPQLPAPRTERISPGHRVALATSPGGRKVVLWRWYDAVVVGLDGASIRLWEPAHGDIVATARTTAQALDLGSRAYVSAGLPGAEWWVAGPVTAGDVELDEVAAFYTDHDLWDTALADDPPRPT